MSAPTGEFAGRTALVTGAARGIGRGSALAFARRGAAVAVCDVLEGKETVDLVRELGVDAEYFPLDVSDGGQVAQVVADVADRFGSLDFAHNNAGTFVPTRFADIDPEDWRRVLAVNLDGVFHCLQQEVRHMLAAGRGGAIVNTASIWAFHGAPFQAAYAASKHGVVGLTRSAAIDHGQDGIRINAVAPGPIETAMTAAVPDEAMAQVIGRTTQQRYGQPGEIGEAVAWLCSDGASYINGTVLPVDGGWLVT